jgi:hypothetical protein
MPLSNSRWPGPAETYSMPSTQAIDTVSGDYEWGALAESKVTFLTHCPSNKEFIARCHKMGVQCFPYVCFSLGITEVAVPSKFPMVLQPPAPADVYQSVNFGASAFWAIDSSGTRNGFKPSHDGVGVTAAGSPPDSYWTCPNVDAYQQRVISWVERLMSEGADGVFIDAIPKSIDPASPSLLPCYADQPGAKFLQFHHDHIFSYNPADSDAATAAQQKAFSLLLERVRHIVLRYGGSVLGNTGLPFQYLTTPGPTITTFNFEYLDPFIENGVLPFLDSDMMEGFLDLGKDSPKGLAGGWAGYWYPYIQAVLGVLSRPQFKGKQILVIPPNPQLASQMGPALLPKGFTCTVRQYHFLTYVAARLAGFIRFVGPLGCYNDFKVNPLLTYQEALQDQFADLARIRLGPPVTGMLHDAQSVLFYRIFENGMVVLNSDMSASHTLMVSDTVHPGQPNPPFPTTKFLDLTDPIGTSTAATRLEIIDVSTTGGILTIPPLSGRVYLFGADTSYLLAQP